MSEMPSQQLHSNSCWWPMAMCIVQIVPEGNINGVFPILKCNFKVKVYRHCHLYEEVAPYELPQLLWYCLDIMQNKNVLSWLLSQSNACKLFWLSISWCIKVCSFHFSITHKDCSNFQTFCTCRFLHPAVSFLLYMWCLMFVSLLAALFTFVHGVPCFMFFFFNCRFTSLGSHLLE